MSRALARRLTRLEQHASRALWYADIVVTHPPPRATHECRASRALWYADIVVTLDHLMAEAGAAVGLAPAGVQALCTALQHTLQDLGQHVPACLTDPRAVEAFMARVTAAVVTMLDTQVADPGTGTRLRAQLAQACDEEDKRRAGLS